MSPPAVFFGIYFFIGSVLLISAVAMLMSHALHWLIWRPWHLRSSEARTR